MTSLTVVNPGQDPMNTELKDVYNEIAVRCSENASIETGGYVDKDLNVCFFDSIVESPDFFIPPHSFYLDIINRKEDILFCFHSHIYNANASEEDIKFIKIYNIPSLIYIIKDSEFLSVNTKYEEDRFSWDIEGIRKEASADKSQIMG